MGYQKVGYHQAQGGCSLVIGRASSPVKSHVFAVRMDEGTPFQIKAGGSPWECSRRGSSLRIQSGVPHSGDDAIVLLERLCGGGGAGLGSSSLCSVHICHNPEGQITVSQARGWWPTSKSAEASLEYKSFQLPYFMPVGGPSIHRHGLDTFLSWVFFFCAHGAQQRQMGMTGVLMLSPSIEILTQLPPSSPKTCERRTACFYC